MSRSQGLIPAADRDYFAAFLKLRGKPGLVVGGGYAAASGVEALLRSGVRVCVVAPELCPRLIELTLVGTVRHEARRFQPGDVVGAQIVISATADPVVDEAVSTAARSLNIPVHVADSDVLSSFAIAPVVDHAPSQIAAHVTGAMADAVQGAAVPRGMVYLVGGGPGNPELLTLRALRVLQLADTILYDHLVSPLIVDLAGREAERIYVGKEANNHALPQHDINALMVKLAKEGRRVVRLKGGDPFIFGRGGEEIETLAAHGVAFEVVPGITAACGAGAFAGIPLTHRDYAHACLFVTGHLKDGSLDLDWDALARPMQTVVIYMGVHGLPLLCERLIAHGLAGRTPAALVEKATLPGQRVVTGTLATIAGLARQEKVSPPALLIVGEVVALREKLAWYKPDRLEETLSSEPVTNEI